MKNLPVYNNRSIGKALVLMMIFITTVFAGSAYAQSGHGKVIEGLEMSSKVMTKPVHYTVYLPPDYDASQRAYPVVYLLHGYTDDDTGWLQFGEMNRLVDAGIADGWIPPMVFVMRDGGVSWYINDYKGDVRWEDMIVDEFMLYIESQNCIRNKKEFRGISGLSMGGYGALVLSMRHPDLFAATAAFSSGIWTDDQMVSMEQGPYDQIYGILYGEGLKGNARLTAHWHAYSVLDIVENSDPGELKKVRYYIDCGDDDFLSIGNSMLRIKLRQKEIPYEYRVRDGAHSWTYWRTGLPDGLAFIGESFRR